ncbi:hypothetical protein L7F22_007182 [Adiantum nelumboides]|nr:hypothetical protein [Adiantum nelumboides]
MRCFQQPATGRSSKAWSSPYFWKQVSPVYEGSAGFDCCNLTEGYSSTILSDLGADSEARKGNVCEILLKQQMLFQCFERRLEHCESGDAEQMSSAAGHGQRTVYCYQMSKDTRSSRSAVLKSQEINYERLAFLVRVAYWEAMMVREWHAEVTDYLRHARRTRLLFQTMLGLSEYQVDRSCQDESACGDKAYLEHAKKTRGMGLFGKGLC